MGIVGGFTGKEGAAVLAAKGAIHGAAGLVTWIGCDGFDSVQRPPELMTRSWKQDGLEPRANVFVIGPGLGTSDSAKQVLKDALGADTDCVLDADALNLLAQDSSILNRENAVLTPHPAEAARLLGCSTQSVVEDPLAAAASLAKAYRATVLLKGAQSIVAEQDGICTLVHEGDATLSTAGTGDVLAGLVGAYLAQGLTPTDAAILGAFVHGRAGTMLGGHTLQRGISASDIAEFVPKVVTQLSLAWTA